MARCVFHFEDFFVKRVFIVNFKTKYLYIDRKLFELIIFLVSCQRFLGGDEKICRGDDEKGISDIGRGLKF